MLRGKDNAASAKIMPPLQPNIYEVWEEDFSLALFLFFSIFSVFPTYFLLSFSLSFLVSFFFLFLPSYHFLSLPVLFFTIRLFCCPATVEINGVLRQKRRIFFYF